MAWPTSRPGTARPRSTPPSGTLLWEQPFQVKDYEHYIPILVVMDKKIAVATSRGVLLLDRGTGRVEHAIDFEAMVMHMAGPPLVVALATVGPPHAEILAIDVDTGQVRARREAGQAVYAFEMQEGVLAVRFERRTAD